MVHGTSQDFFNAADYFVDRNVRQGRGHKMAVYTEHRNYTYNDIQKMTNKSANALRTGAAGSRGRYISWPPHRRDPPTRATALQS